jgi:hypothetical protein
LQQNRRDRHLEETPWCQRGTLMWMWVAVTATAVFFRIGTRRKEELAVRIGEAFLGWLVTDGYAAYRDHPRRQRCLAHLIRKGLALGGGLYGDGVGFGRDLVPNLRGLIERVRDGEADSKAVRRLMDAIKWSCQCNRHEIEQKVPGQRNPQRLGRGDRLRLRPAPAATNNDSERALRHAVIARRIGRFPRA